jgi:hypothetical protein
MNPYKFIKLILSKPKDTDFSRFLSRPQPSRKQLIVDKCERKNISIYIDDASEQSAGIYAKFRGVASEAELDRRLIAKQTITLKRLICITSILGLFIAFWKG